MKLKHPTHDPKPMDALSYYLQVQREYALAREGYLRIDEADDTYNDLNRKIINAYRERYGMKRPASRRNRYERRGAFFSSLAPGGRSAASRPPFRECRGAG